LLAGLRAEGYFVPAGTNPNANVNRNDPEIAKKAMQNLIAQNMRGGAVESADGFVVLNVPDEEKILEGTGDNAITRVVLFDNKAKRASGVTAETVLTLKAGKKPLNLPIILGAAGIIVVILLLVIVLVRGGGGGGGKRKRSNQPPPAPVVAGGGGVPPYQGGGYQPPPGGGYGGYGASAVADEPALAGFKPSPPIVAPPPPDPGGGGYPLAAAGGAPVVQVRCPACNMLTMTSRGQGSICFSCGQPLPRDLPAEARDAQAHPLTDAMESSLEPPPDPHGVTGASIVGASGQFAIKAGIDVRVGRDPAQCPVTLSEPRVSGVHATLRFENGKLMVRDERSNNGTYVNGARIAPVAFTPIASGGRLRFGPVEFTVRVE
jgi:hypothetical protein